jgi:metal-responsive CopG/Arc/MetJ family transcriptional regulator
MKSTIEIPEDLILNMDDIIDQIEFKTREEFIIAAIRHQLDTYNQILLENC